jgi:hypothetical protein
MPEDVNPWELLFWLEYNLAVLRLGFVKASGGSFGKRGRVNAMPHLSLELKFIIFVTRSPESLYN